MKTKHGTSIRKLWMTSLMSVGWTALMCGHAMAVDDNALPSGGNVVGGNASFDYSTPNQLHVHQSSDRAVINWDSFNIGANALTQFHQNSSSSLVVNRVTGDGQDPTQILGSLRANGRVMVLDRNGVFFGANSTIDVGSIIASTGEVDTAAVMNGDTALQISNVDTGGAIINNGSITVAEAGLAAFVSPTIVNNGVITAKMGRVQLASGTAATLDLYGDGLVELAVDTPLENALIENTGAIHAEGGAVHITAAAAKDMVDTVINTSGVIDVSSVTVKGGKIILEGANTQISGTLNASGKTGGGSIKIGGDYKGGGAIRAAQKTTLTQDSRVTANATDTGNGGEIIVWSEKQTQVDGVLEAKGGQHGGNGGFIETSSREFLQIAKDTVVSVGAMHPLGIGGEWLLDPEDIVISDSGNDGNAATSDIASATINATLNGGGNVTITTSGAMAGTGNITLNNANIGKSVSNNNVTLKLEAHESIISNNSNITNTSGNALNVVLNADRDANQSGAISLTNTNITTNGGYFVAGGGSGVLWGADGLKDTADDTASTGADRVSAWGKSGISDGVLFNNSDIVTASGDIIINGNGFNNSAAAALIGIRLTNGASLASTSGKITLRGFGGNGTSDNHGVFAIGTNTTISSGTGAINITGQAGSNSLAGSANNYGFFFDSGSRIESTGINTDASTITMTGTGGSGQSFNYGGRFTGSTVISKRGDINITGNGGGLGSLGANSSNFGLRISGSSNITADGDADITITGNHRATDSSPEGFGISVGSNVIGGATATGNIILNADYFNLMNLDVRTSGTIFVRPNANTTTIGLGGGTGNLNLSDAELAFFNAGTLVIGSATGTGDIDLDSWDLSAKNHNVEIYGNDIDIGGLTLGTGNFMAHAMDNAAVDLGTLTVSAATTKSLAGTTSFTLRADRDIIFNTGSNITTTTGLLNTVLNADRDADQDGMIDISANIDTNGGATTMGGGSGTITAGSGYAVGNTVTNRYGVNVNAGYTINANGGDININGRGFNDAGDANFGVRVAGNLLTNGNGKITLNGIGGGTGASVANFGVGLVSGTISAVNGDISITGNAGNNSGSGLSQIGINVNAGTVQTTGTGTISFIGQGGTSTGTGNYGISLNGGSILSNGGLIYIRGTAAGGAGSSVNYGIATASTITNNNGAITLEGYGGPGASSRGLRIQAGTTINGGSGTITLTGTHAAGGDGIHATGGTIGGATTSGNIIMDFDTISMAGGTAQTTGTLFIRPRTASTTIGLGGGTGTLNLTDAELALFNAGTLVIGSATGTGDIDLDSWDLSAKTHNVELYGNDIDIGGLTLGTGNFMAHAMDNAAIDLGSLTVSAATSKSLAGTTSLTLRADRDIIFNTGSNITTTTGLLNTVLNADRDADQDGAITINSSVITTNGGNFIAGGGSGALGGTNGILGDGDGTGADDIAAWGNSTQAIGVLFQNADISTGSGKIFITGHGYNGNPALDSTSGISIGSGSVLETTTGNIGIKGTGGLSRDSNFGVHVQNAGTIVRSEKGVITITGQGGTNGSNTSDFNSGIGIFSGASVSSTGTGSDAATIFLNGTGGAGYTGNHGIIIDAAEVNTIAGDMTLVGIGASNGANAAPVSRGIRLIASGDIVSTGTGNIYMTGTSAVTAAEDDIFADTGSVFGGASAGGTVSFNANTVTIDLATVQTSGSVLFRPRTASTTIGLGGGTGTLNLSDTELANITASNLIIGDSALGTGDVAVTTWNLSSKTHNVSVFGNDITLGGLTLGTGNFTAHARDNAAIDLGTLTVNAAITKSLAGTSALTLRADKDLVFTAGGITTTTGSLNTVLNADRDADQDGAISMANAAVSTNGGYFVAGGGSGTLWGADGIKGTADDAASTGADNVAAWGNTTYLAGVTLNSNSNVNTAGGDIIIRGHGGIVTPTGAHGINLSNSSLLTSGTGIITLDGVGGGNGANSFNYGFTQGGTSTITTASGNISVRGVAGTGTAGSGSYGVAATTITSTSGAISISGTGGTGGNFNHGFRYASGAINSGSGALNITGIAGTNGTDMTMTGGTIGGGGQTGEITLNADTISNSGTAITGTNRINVTPRTASTSIGLGGGAGTLNLDDGELGRFTAGTLIIGSTLSTGDVGIASWDLSAKPHNVQIYGNDFNLAGITLGAGDVTMYAKGGGIQVSAASVSNAGGDLNLLSAYDIAIDQALSNAGTGHVNLFAGWDGASAITTPALFDLDDVTLGAISRNITIGSAGSLSSGGTGTAILAVASGNFYNNSSLGFNAVSAVGGRYLIYAEDPAVTIKNGLMATDLYQKNYNADPLSTIGGTQSLFIFENAALPPVPVVTMPSITEDTWDIVNITVNQPINKLEEVSSEISQSEEQKSDERGCLVAVSNDGCAMN
jgi:trimeric autotransporter adhesin